MPSSRIVIPDLAGKAILVTGGSTGIGAAVALGFAEQGARVAIGYHASEAPALALKREIESGAGKRSQSGATSPIQTNATALSPKRSPNLADSTVSSTTPA